MESSLSEIHLVDTPLQAFKLLLKYIYSGQLDFDDLKTKEVIIDMFCLCNRYGFDKLLSSMCSQAGSLLSLDTVAMFYEAGSFYQLDDLAKKCLEYVDEHAVEFLKSPFLTKATSSTITTIFGRDTFCAPEVLLFIAAEVWLVANGKDCSETDQQLLLSTVRLPLIDHDKLVSKITESGLYSGPQVSDALQAMQCNQTIERLTRFGCLLDQNVFQKERHLVNSSNAQVRGTEVARHELRDTSPGILIELHKPFLVNKIRWKVSASLVDPINSPYPAFDSFLIQVSLDGVTFRTIVDRDQGSNYIQFWSERAFHFKPQVVQFVRIKGRNRNIHLEREMSYWFQVKAFELLFTSNPFEISASGILRPMFNCAAIPYTENTPKEDLFRADCGLELKYKWPRNHRINGKYIEFTLEHMSELNHMKLLLWDEDKDIAFGYVIQVSSDDKEWVTVVDKKFEERRSWQEHHFAARNVFFIRIQGKAVYNSDCYGNIFKLVHFECCYK